MAQAKQATPLIDAQMRPVASRNGFACADGNRAEIADDGSMLDDAAAPPDPCAEEARRRRLRPTSTWAARVTLVVSVVAGPVACSISTPPRSSCWSSSTPFPEPSRTAGDVPGVVDEVGLVAAHGQSEAGIAGSTIVAPCRSTGTSSTSIR
jgi:hypothetical protein